jgi:hypothetical protein
VQYSRYSKRSPTHLVPHNDTAHFRLLHYPIPRPLLGITLTRAHGHPGQWTPLPFQHLGRNGSHSHAGTIPPQDAPQETEQLLYPCPVSVLTTLMTYIHFILPTFMESRVLEALAHDKHLPLTTLSELDHQLHEIARAYKSNGQLTRQELSTLVKWKLTVFVV